MIAEEQFRVLLASALASAYAGLQTQQCQSGKAAANTARPAYRSAAHKAQRVESRTFELRPAMSIIR